MSIRALFNETDISVDNFYEFFDNESIVWQNNSILGFIAEQPVELTWRTFDNKLYFNPVHGEVTEGIIEQLQQRISTFFLGSDIDYVLRCNPSSIRLFTYFKS